MIILFGKTSQIGSCLYIFLKKKYKIFAPSSLECNFLKGNDVEKYILIRKPKLIINCSAYTNVELAERENKKCRIINVDAVRYIAKAAKNINAWVVHYSTDYVFNGNKKTPYIESDRVAPINYYGQTKLLSERELEKYNCNYSIIRTSWVLSRKYNSFSSKIISKLKTQKELSVVTDQFGSPNSAKFIAKKSSQIINKIYKNPKKNYKGIFHLSSTGIINWYNLCLLILKKRKINLKKFNIKKISSTSLKSSVARPLYSKLNSNLVKKVFNIRLINYKKLLKDF
jgi:dTDP-4-dehydrorhamnose reductase